MSDGISLREGNVRDPRIVALLERHLAQMRAQSPPESVHALDLEGLCRPEITFWSLWEGETVLACGALKALSQTEGEVNSMHTAAEQRGRGLADRLVQHVIATARARGYRRLWLETGSFDSFTPARRLYARHGFELCGPFADYTNDPNSAFMTLVL